MSKLNHHLRHEIPDKLRHVLQCLDAVVQKEHLSAAIHFATYGHRDILFVELGDHRADRVPVVGRRREQGHIANLEERHVERSGNRRRRQGERVDICL